LKNPIRIAALSLVGILIASIAFAGDLLAASTTWDVFDDQAVNIGDISVSSTGNMYVFNDNPDTNHPPNTNSSWAKNSEGSGYGNGAGHTVTYTDIGEGQYYWEKTDDSTQQVLDYGTISPKDVE